MTDLKEELIKWLKDSNSQWVFDEVARIKQTYEKRAKELSEEQKDMLSRRVQLLSWGKIDLIEHTSIDTLKFANDVIDEDINSFPHADQKTKLEKAYAKIAQDFKPSDDPTTIRAFIVDELNACIYYVAKRKYAIIMSVFGLTKY